MFSELLRYVIFYYWRMLVLDNKFEIGQFVYLVTDEEQVKRIVTKLSVTYGNIILYQLCYGATVSDHYEIEISETENIEIK